MFTVLILLKEKSEAAKYSTIILRRSGGADTIYARDLYLAAEICIEKNVDLFVVEDRPDSIRPYELSGLRFIQYIRGHDKSRRTPIIITSKLYYMDERVRGSGNIFYIEKPMDNNIHAKLIQEAVDLAVRIKKDTFYWGGICDCNLSRLIFIQGKGYLKTVKESDLYWIENHSHSSVFHLKNEELMVDSRMATGVIGCLDHERFIKVGRYDIVNVTFIDHISKSTISFRDGLGTIMVSVSASRYLRRYLDEMRCIELVSEEETDDEIDAVNRKRR